MDDDAAHGLYSAADVVSVEDEPANRLITKIPHFLGSIGVENFPAGGETGCSDVERRDDPFPGRYSWCLRYGVVLWPAQPPSAA